MESTHIGELPIPHLPREARIAHLFPALGETSLISIGQLCDHGCQAHFSATTVVITYENKLILQGHRSDETRGLWYLKIPTQHLAMHAVNHIAKPEDLVAFAHAALFSPANSTMLTALQKGFLPPFQGLSVTTLRKYAPHSAATIKGHLDGVRQKMKSTKTVPPKTIEEMLDEAFPSQLQTGERTHFVYAVVCETKGQVHSDLTGRFHTPSSKGKHYILIVYCYDSNAILMRALQNRQAKTILDAYKSIHAQLLRGGCRPKLQRLDNEASNILKSFMKDENIDFQQAPPNTYTRSVNQNL